MLGKVKVDVTFEIDTLGMIQNIMVKAPHIALEEEAIRVVKLIPKMTPGYIDGNPVVVPYSVPISVEIINPKLMRWNKTKITPSIKTKRNKSYNKVISDSAMFSKKYYDTKKAASVDLWKECTDIFDS